MSFSLDLWVRGCQWRLGLLQKEPFSVAMQEKFLPFFETRGVEYPTLLDPISDRIRAAVPLMIYERRDDFLALLRQRNFKVLLSYAEHAGFSALPDHVCLGVPALERAWVFSYVCASAYVHFLSGGPFAIEAPPDDELAANGQHALAWACANDGLNHEYPADLPRPRANYGDGTGFDRLLMNTFIAAIAWITLHETAHVVFGHFGGNPTPEQSREEELIADRWATEWIMAIAPKAERSWRLMGAALGIAIAAYLELRANHVGPRDHPNFPDRLIATLDRFGHKAGSKKLEKGLWAMGSILIYKRALIMDAHPIFDGYEPFVRPRQFIQRASELFPNG